MELARDRVVFGGKKAAGCIQCELKTRGRTMAPVEPGGAGGSSQRWERKAYGGFHFSRTKKCLPTPLRGNRSESGPLLVHGMGHRTFFILFFINSFPLFSSFQNM